MKLTLKDGSNKEFGVYEGELVDGKPHGKGKCTYVNGDVYEGGWVNGKRQGEGKMFYANGDVYEGEFKNLPHGRGKKTFKDGAVFQGEYLHGYGKEGTRTEADGTKKELGVYDTLAGLDLTGVSANTIRSR